MLTTISSQTKVESEVTFDVAAVNSMIYLRPYYGADEVPNPYDDFYYVYIQTFDNNNLSFSEDKNFGPFEGDNWAAYTRPALVNYQDGTYRIVFVAKDGETYVYGSDFSEVVALEADYVIEDVSYSPDGKLLSWVVADSPYIYVYNYETEEVTYQLVALPSSSQSGADFPVSTIDTVRFGPTSRKVVFDYLVCDFQSSVSCDDDEALDYWSVGVLDIETMNVSFPFAAQPSRYDVGFPAFPNLTDRYIVVDLIDNQAENESGYDSAIFIYDLDQKTLSPIVGTDGKSDATGHYGTPSFSTDDSSLIFSFDTDSGPRLYAIDLTDYKRAEKEDPFSLLNPSEASMPFSVPYVSVEKKPSIALDKSSFDFGDVTLGSVSSPVSICVENTGEFAISISTDNAIQDYAISGLFKSVVEGKQKKCVGIALNSQSIAPGAFDRTFSLNHDGINSPTPITLKAYVDTDTDDDGTLDYKDTDDDNDEVLDVDDAFPLDATESVDTDGDGTGDNADTDDDNDSLSDIDENSMGTNPLLVDTDADGVADNLDALPLDETETTDTDGDGIGNNTDEDDDGDSLSDFAETSLGTNPLLSDSDSDGVDDNLDAFPLNSSESTDSDGDGVGDNADLFPKDATETGDADADGIGDNADAFDDDPFEAYDSDLDGIGNNADPDDDNDGFNDVDEIAAGTDPLSASSCPVVSPSTLMTMVKPKR